MNYDDQSLALHKKYQGKIETTTNILVQNKDDLSVVYSPGVAAPCREIAEKPETVFDYTLKGRTVAIVTDGSAVLGLGNIGPQAALPVMEGKAMLFKQFAGIDAFPICLDTQNVDEIVQAVRMIAPTFGGINLEDISAPRCFEVESRLQDLGIPVFHDDQHGTAVVVLAGLLNATKVVGKKIEDLVVVVNGAGAAGVAIVNLLSCYGDEKGVCIPVKDILVCDSKGIIYEGRDHMNDVKTTLAKNTNREKCRGTLADAVQGADVFIGVSVAGALTTDMVHTMNADAIIFALANPIPEIFPKDAHAAGAAVVATGRSDYPNQINNVLAFPGIFKGALAIRATQITPVMKYRAVQALTKIVDNPTRERILPDPFDPQIVEAVSRAVSQDDR